jgi:hypothetical protein
MEKIERRRMLKTLGFLSLGRSIMPAFGGEPDLNRQSGRSLNIIKTDVLVVGGGTAGVIAAIQAGRAGCSTILVENGPQLGGTITTGGVAFPGLFYAWGKKVIDGIGWELVNDCVKLDDGKFPDFSTQTAGEHWKFQVRINGFLYALLAEEKCLEAGVKIRYYETPVSLRFTGNNWEVEIVGKGTHIKVVCNQLIDCTGNASVCSLAGLNILREDEIQPGTLMFRIGGYDYNSLNLEMIQKRYEEEVKKGSLNKEEFQGIERLLSSSGDNVQHIAGADSSTSEANTLTNINGRRSLLTTLRFLRELPGCEKTRLLSMQPETGVRETYRVDGVYKITHDDSVSGRTYEDSVSYSYYPIDLHTRDGVTPKPLKEGVVAQIPLRALIPRQSRNILVAGRCISSDRLANSALRVQASCMGMGQAAGAAAALACKLNLSPMEVDINKVRSLIADNGGIVPKN